MPLCADKKGDTEYSGSREPDSLTEWLADQEGVGAGISGSKVLRIFIKTKDTEKVRNCTVIKLTCCVSVSVSNTLTQVCVALILTAYRHKHGFYRTEP